MGKFLRHLETPRVYPTGKSNSEILQFSVLCILPNSSACIVCILPQFLIEEILRHYQFHDCLIVSKCGGEFCVPLLRLRKAVPL